ncbi:ParE family toxin-like protein [Citrobacter portucalensis]
MQTTTSHVSECIINKASILLSEYYGGKKNYHRIKPHHYLKIDVSLRWRLLSKNNGKTWSLMTCERFSKESKI